MSDKSRTAPGHVVLVSSGAVHRDVHERIARRAIAQRLADLIGYEFAGDYDASRRHAHRLYFVPDDTLLLDFASGLGIRTEDDLFGGVVPHRFVGTKAITHSTVSPEAVAPDGWVPDLGERLSTATLRGYSAFTLDDARTAAARLVDAGRVRIKPAQISGGVGQHVIENLQEIEAALAALDSDQVREHGVVVEQNLEDATTHSVGQLHVGGMSIAYHGTQRVTRNHRGHEVYGGSDLLIVRGSLDDLLQLDADSSLREVIGKARAYDAIVAREFPSFFASRRNYDVARGRDRDGCSCCGVLEQSWRIGGASAAEIAALEAFGEDRTLRAVHASTHEVYSADEPPADAKIHFRGHDANVGFLTKYSTIRRHGNQA